MIGGKKMVKNKINHKCIICELTQEDLLKRGGALMLAVFPTDADGSTKGNPQPLCRNCWRRNFRDNL